jgi:hypothetical protein
MLPDEFFNYFAGGVAGEVCPDAAGLAAAVPGVAGLLVLECFFTCGLVWAGAAFAAGAGAVAGFAGVAGAVAPDCASAPAAVSMETKIIFFISLSFSFLPKSVGLRLVSPSQTHHAANAPLWRSHPQASRNHRVRLSTASISS